MPFIFTALSSLVQEDDMLRPTVASLGLVIALFSTTAQAHPTHADCRVGNTWAGRTLHFHPGGNGDAVMCRGGGRYQQQRYYDQPQRYYQQPQRSYEEDDDEPRYRRRPPQDWRYR